MTLLDVLGFRQDISICTAYEIDGHKTDVFPVPAKLAKAKPILETLPGWRSDVSDIRRYEDLPREAQDYVRTIEKLIDVPIKWISVGPRREAIIKIP